MLLLDNDIANYDHSHACIFIIWWTMSTDWKNNTKSTAMGDGRCRLKISQMLVNNQGLLMYMPPRMGLSQHFFYKNLKLENWPKIQWVALSFT